MQAATGKAAEIALTAVGVKLPDNALAARSIKTVSLRVESAQTMNANDEGQGLATVMRLYKLRDRHAFLSAPYTSFDGAGREKQVLGPDLLETKELILLPGQKLDLKEKVSADAAYIGIVTLFRLPAPQRWRYLFAVSDVEKSGVTLGIHKCAMTAANAAPLGMAAENPALLSSTRCN